MAEIQKITQVTDEPYLNMYLVQGVNSKGHHSNYFVASRARHIEDLKIKTKQDTADGVVIYSLYGEKKDRVVLIRQYRYPLDGFIYEFPAGLVEPNEEFHSAAIRELHEETGLTFTPLDVDPMYEKPRFTSCGMSDESNAIVYGYASGEISGKYAEPSEEIEIVLADRDEVRRILREERVSLVTAYQLMHFLSDEEPFAFLK
ncbi:MAG: NUDIX hydrolase [Eubacterium sp.]|nr:NUDIX hydrolase [Eubacterium sp.]